ncbi:MAG TPA: hypothetical protein VG077_08935 [Verrucomicrobiae bacterium]|nr:hypothetical protein [Verrucomicrobiae bacterium]
MLASECEAVALGFELPKAVCVGTDMEDVAILPARHIQNQKAEAGRRKAENETQQEILRSSVCLLHWYFITP